MTTDTRTIPANPGTPLGERLPTRSATLCRSDELDQLFSALSKAQANLQNVIKDHTAKIQTREKGTYTYQYESLADVLEALRPALPDHGLCLTQWPVGSRDDFRLWTILGHGESGQFIAGCLNWPLPDSLNPQEIGKVITYLRRYTASPATGVASEKDDDAESVQGKLDAAKRATGGKVAPASQMKPANPPPAHDETAAEPVPLTEDDAKYIADATQVVETTETLAALNEWAGYLATKSEAVKAALRPLYKKRKAELETAPKEAF